MKPDRLPLAAGEEPAELADVVYGLVRLLMARLDMTHAQAKVVCRATERAMRMAAERGDFSLQLAAEAVKVECHPHHPEPPLPCDFSKARVVN